MCKQEEEWKDLKPAHFTGTLTLDEIWLGRVVWVHAWWTNSDDLVKCEVRAKHPPQKLGYYMTDDHQPFGPAHLTVHPLTGNTHARHIDLRTVVY